jgi:hypothetical protein
MRTVILVVFTSLFAASCATQTICDYVTCVEGGEGGEGGGDAGGGGGS